MRNFSTAGKLGTSNDYPVGVGISHTMALSFGAVKKVIEEHTRFLLTTHVNPDGDAIGSEIALALFLRKLGKTVVIINHSRTPDNYRWLDPDDEIVTFDPGRDRDAVQQQDVIFIVDANAPERLGTLEPYVIKSPAVLVVIDHHLEAPGLAHHEAVDEDATSTGEILFRLFFFIDESKIDPRVATALYAAILTDTGSFRFPRTDPETHRIIARLIELGADPPAVYISVYEHWSLGRMQLLGETLGSIKTAYGGKLAYLVCSLEMFRKTLTTIEDTDNFTDYPMSIAGVVAAVVFTELTDGVKISFRSRGNIAINELAKEFGGNGHLNAAGARILHVKLQDAISMVLEKAGRYINAQ